MCVSVCVFMETLFLWGSSMHLYLSVCVCVCVCVCPADASAVWAAGHGRVLPAGPASILQTSPAATATAAAPAAATTTTAAAAGESVKTQSINTTGQQLGFHPTL